MEQIKHYIRVDENGLIIKSFTTAFEQPLDGDICVNEDGGRHFNLELFDDENLPALKYKRGEIMPTIEADIEHLRPIIPESNLTIEQRIDNLELVMLESEGIIDAK